jgi:hypothetical protein
MNIAKIAGIAKIVNLEERIQSCLVGYKNHVIGVLVGQQDGTTTRQNQDFCDQDCSSLSLVAAGQGSLDYRQSAIEMRHVGWRKLSCRLPSPIKSGIYR